MTRQRDRELGPSSHSSPRARKQLALLLATPPASTRGTQEGKDTIESIRLSVNVKIRVSCLSCSQRNGYSNDEFSLGIDEALKKLILRLWWECRENLACDALVQPRRSAKERPACAEEESVPLCVEFKCMWD